MSTALVEPEHGRDARRARPAHSQLHPVADGHVLGLTHAPDVTLGDHVLEHHVAALTARVDHPDGAGARDLEGLVVGAVLLGGLCHQADVGDRAHRGGVVGAVGAAVVEHDLVDPGVRRVGDHREGVGLLTVGAPHVARGADHRRHGGVDDHVARHVQVGDPLVGVHHRERRAVGDPGVDRRLDVHTVGQRLDALEDRAETVVGAQTGLAERLAVPGEQLGQERADDVAEDDRVGDLHHRGLEVHREQHALLLRARDLRGEELLSRGHASWSRR